MTEALQLSPTDRPHSVLLYGPPGSGKTWSLRTIPPSSPTFIIFTDTHGPSSLASAFASREIPPHIHYTVIKPKAPFSSILSALSQVSLGGEKPADQQVGNYIGQQAYLSLINKLKDLRCDCHSKSFGSLDSLPPEATLVLDNVTGFNDIILLALGGFNSTMTIQKWGTAVSVSLNALIRGIVDNFKGLFICIAHAGAEADELTNARIVFPDFVGVKLPARVAKYFGDTIFATRQGLEFSWSTAAINAQTVPRRLPLAAKLPPTFEPFFSTKRKEANNVKR